MPGHPDYRGNMPLIGMAGTSRAMTVKLLRVHHADDVLDLGDHAADRRRIDQLGDAADAVEPQPDQRLALRMMTAAGAADLPDPHGLSAGGAWGGPPRPR